MKSRWIGLFVYFMLSTLMVSEPEQEQSTPILDTYSYWRVFVTLRPVLFGTAEKAEQHESGRIAHQSYSKPPVLPPDKPETSLPPSNWQNPDFDDTRWLDPGPFLAVKMLGYSDT